MATWEEASHCPKCDEPGEDTKQHSIPTGKLRGGKAHILTCRNERCKWFNTNWVVAVGPDGAIPEYRKGPKEFEFSPAMEAHGRRMIEQAALNDPLIAENLRLLDKQIEQG